MIEFLAMQVILKKITIEKLPERLRELVADRVLQMEEVVNIDQT